MPRQSLGVLPSVPRRSVGVLPVRGKFLSAGKNQSGLSNVFNRTANKPIEADTGRHERLHAALSNVVHRGQTRQEFDLPRWVSFLNRTLRIPQCATPVPWRSSPQVSSLKSQVSSLKPVDLLAFDVEAEQQLLISNDQMAVVDDWWSPIATARALLAVV